MNINGNPDSNLAIFQSPSTELLLPDSLRLLSLVRTYSSEPED